MEKVTKKKYGINCPHNKKKIIAENVEVVYSVNIINKNIIVKSVMERVYANMIK